MVKHLGSLQPRDIFIFEGNIDELFIVESKMPAKVMVRRMAFHTGEWRFGFSASVQFESPDSPVIQLQLSIQEKD